MREEFVKRVLSGEASKSALCREYGISRPTGDKWIKRYEAGQALEDQSRPPVNRPRETPIEMEQEIVTYRKEHPAIGARKLRRILENKGHQDMPSHSTINRIFAKNGLIMKDASLAATPHQWFEKKAPNEMWQADYKGHFAMGNGQRCHPLNIIDDYSRFNVCCQAQLTETFEEIKPVIIRVFQEYGIPFSLLCDNGNPWGTVQSTGFSRFEVWLMELGILTLHGRIHHPQTQGKTERARQKPAFHQHGEDHDSHERDVPGRGPDGHGGGTGRGAGAGTLPACGGVLADIRAVGLQVLLVPLAVAAGALACAMLAGLFLPMGVKDAVTAASGFGWYSLAPTLLAPYSLSVSAVAFLSNVLREVLSLAVPVLVPAIVGL